MGKYKEEYLKKFMREFLYKFIREFLHAKHARIAIEIPEYIPSEISNGAAGEMPEGVHRGVCDEILYGFLKGTLKK